MGVKPYQHRNQDSRLRGVWCARSVLIERQRRPQGHDHVLTAGIKRGQLHLCDVLTRQAFQTRQVHEPG